MANEEYDVVVIGSGPGGYVAAIRAAQLGLKTACIEKNQSLGGTCLNVGCIPSKALLQSSEHFAWLKHQSAQHGILCDSLSVDFGQMMKRKEQVVQSLVGAIPQLFKKHGVISIQGEAHFVSTNSVELRGQNRQITARNFILATGSEPIALPFAPFDEKVILSSTGALSLNKIPQKMVVVGAGVIGVELASVYNRLGCEVVIVEMLDRICVGMDDALSRSLLQILKKQGIQFHLGAKVTQVKKSEKHAVVQVQLADGAPASFDADVVLVAIGRRPFSAGLGLEDIGVKMERGLVLIDNDFRSSISNIYAIGDLVEGPMLAHKASEEGYAVAEIIAGEHPHINYLAIPNVVYTHPEVAAVGLTEAEAKELGIKDIVVGSVSFKGNPRARCSGDTDGMVKVIGAGDEKYLVGLHIIGPQASELINMGVVAIEKKMTLRELATSPQAHPSLSEAIKEACGQALGIAIHS